METTNEKTTTEWHVFTNERDDWFDNFDEAKALFTKWGEEFGCARLYIEVRYESDGELDYEDCIENIGEFPW